MTGEESSWDMLDQANESFMDDHWVCHHGEEDAGDFVEKGSACPHCGSKEQPDETIDPGFFWEELADIEKMENKK